MTHEIKQGSSAAITITSPFEKGSKRHRFNREAVLRDYRVGVRSRHASVLGRTEVLTGRAKFGIFGDGKEVAQLAMAYAFRKGDLRSGYYRDQTFMFALGVLTVREFFAQLYAHADLEAEPAFGGRSMTGHFATRFLKTDGTWKPLIESYHSAADLSPTASQMPRLVGLAHASKVYRLGSDRLRELARGFTDQGNEVAFGTIGNASCAEGMFWEAVNAVGVLQAPMLLSIWDDGYGISVPNRFQLTKGDVSKVLEGFRHRAGGRPGYQLYTVPGWDYPTLCLTYYEAHERARRDHRPAIIHVAELTQPLGHSTSGSHERYKTPERLQWEKEFDCLRQMREWILSEGFATAEELDAIEEEEKRQVAADRDRAWEAYRAPLDQERRELVDLARAAARTAGGLTGESAGEAGSTDVRAEAGRDLEAAIGRLEKKPNAVRKDLLAFAAEVLLALRDADPAARRPVVAWKRRIEDESRRRYSSHLWSEGSESALLVPEVKPAYSDSSPTATGFEILNACFDAAFEREPRLHALGEDVGRLGDVNQGFAHLQEKYGELRVSDTGIREITIVGQAIGMALRGLRPIAEIQYLDYLLYALQIMSDDLASLRWRTAGGQKAPVIIRTRGHRLEGIWHAGSPMAGVIHLLRGIYVCVPRDATQAAGFYNTLLEGDDPALIVEVLNAYRKRAKVPDNIGEMKVPLGVPEVVREGTDLTVVTYGACVPIALEAAERLASIGIEAEVIDVRTLLPFDRPGLIGQSLEKTNRVLFVDEDVPGGTTAFMLEQVLEHQGGFDLLDAPPRTLTAQEHRTPYGTDGDYFAKPNRESVFEAGYELMHESDPTRWPLYYR
ncbi:MAG TPA: transketolase C-terminal domain-containing protein [Thermoanaerobaculia bacterium]|nr:transketolase C-terminal domain-containing protein [Thermoanaerobaculia bacterium]